jgi:hypothetical protein
VEIPVPPEVAAKFGTTDTAVINQRKLVWYMPNTMQVGSIKAIRVQDLIVLDIVRTNQWKRPIYFAVTCAPDSRIGLDDYLWFHGLAFRLEPRQATQASFGLDAKVLEANLLNEPQGFSTGPQYGYKFRGINDPSVYYDENTTRLMLNYRTAFIRLALYYSNAMNNNARAVEVLDRMEAVIPRTKIPLGWELASDLAAFYYRAGKTEQFESLAAEIETTCSALIESGQANLNSYWNPYRVLLDLYDMKKEYAKAIELMKSLQIMIPNDPSVQQRIAVLEAQLAAQNAGTADTARRAGTPQ